MGDTRGGIAEWQKTLAIDGDDGNALNNLAWVLATFPQDEIRNGKRAVELATKASALPGGESPMVLRTLAAAYAEGGDFPRAVSVAQRALDLATAQNNNSLAATLRHELALYQANTPYREAPPP
jgi:tetratricopeptide (TPR) repeat protein